MIYGYLKFVETNEGLLKLLDDISEIRLNTPLPKVNEDYVIRLFDAPKYGLKLVTSYVYRDDVYHIFAIIEEEPFVSFGE